MKLAPLAKPDLKWLIKDHQCQITTSSARVDSPFGFAHIRRYEHPSQPVAYVAVVVDGNHVAALNCGNSLETALYFTQHPFRVINPADYWNGAEILGVS